MTQEEKELLLRDLCARLPYKVILLAPNGRTIYQTDGNTGVELFVEEGWKPYLRPMSSMTKKELDRYDILEEETIYRPGVLICLNLIDFCNAHHFDYRGLIEKGLALEAPEGMYKK